MISDTNNKDSTLAQETTIWTLWPYLFTSAFTEDNIQIIYTWIINIYINIFWSYLSKSSVTVKFSNSSGYPQWTQEYADIDLNAQNATTQSIRSWIKKSTNLSIVSFSFIVALGSIPSTPHLDGWLCMSVYNIRKKKVISLGVCFPKMNHGSQQWLGNSAIVQEMHVVVYFPRCLICSVSSQ